MKNLEVDGNVKKLKKTKEEINNQLEESIMRDDNMNIDMQKSARKVKSSEEAAAVIQEMGKIIRSKRSNMLWLTNQQGKMIKLNQW